MSDRPSAINGKRSRSWGTLVACPSCGQCLCFGCHPSGPCVDDAERPPAGAGEGASRFALPAFGFGTLVSRPGIGDPAAG